MAMISAVGSTKGSAGFTLIELMTVVLIIVFLAGLMLGAGSYLVKRSAIKSAEAQIMSISRALDRYAADHRSYPQPLSSVSLFPPDASDTERGVLCPGLALSAISSQYSDVQLDYYTATISELDVNSDNQLDDDDKYTGEFVLLDVWGYPLYYYVEARTISVSGTSYSLYFGKNNKNGCDLGSRGPNHIADSGSLWVGSVLVDDLCNWK